MSAYGYIRVSSSDQNEDRQRIALMEAGVPEANIFLDKQSGKDFNRPEYKRLVGTLEQGDVLFVHSLDRFGRNYDDILWQWRFVTKKKEADIVVLDMPLLDTREKKDELMGKVISDIVLQLLSYVAQTEREFIRKRQAEGIAAARARGVRLGRRPMDRPDNFRTVCSAWERGEISARSAAKRLNVSHPTFLRWVKDKEEESHGRDHGGQ